MKETIHTEIEIEASADRVWKVLTDLSSYSEWNPMIRRAGGELKPEARLSLRFEPAGRKGYDFHPKLLVVDQNRELRWLGRPSVPGIFELHHVFIIEKKGDGKVRLDHEAIIYGFSAPFVRAPFIRRRLEDGVAEPFRTMNQALKARAETTDG